MKKRRIVVTAFLLCACMLIGVGYAALSGSISANATIRLGLNHANLKVQYRDEAGDVSAVKDSVDLTRGTDLAEPATQYMVELDSTKTAATIHLNTNILKVKNDVVTFTLTLVNNSTDVDAKIDAPKVTMGANSDTYLDINAVAAEAGQKMIPGDTTTYTITVKLKEIPIESAVECNFSVIINTHSFS